MASVSLGIGWAGKPALGPDSDMLDQDLRLKFESESESRKRCRRSAAATSGAQRS